MVYFLQQTGRCPYIFTSFVSLSHSCSAILYWKWLKKEYMKWSTCYFSRGLFTDSRKFLEPVLKKACRIHFNILSILTFNRGILKLFFRLLLAIFWHVSYLISLHIWFSEHMNTWATHILIYGICEILLKINSSTVLFIGKKAEYLNVVKSH